MLSTDILTEFRGRGDEIRIHPLSFAEFYSAAGGDKKDAFDQYAFPRDLSAGWMIRGLGMKEGKSNVCL